ncbi:hypothetical protein KEM52_006050 [Ascosphaera acerosa]|nr:hypothetical protein KEM52_006050 [Ascosphaera acerosa]
MQILTELSLGIQLGATAVTLLMIVFLTRRSQRKTWVFRWNSIALLFNVLRLIAFLLYDFTGLADPYSIQSNDFTMITAGENAVPSLQLWFSTLLVTSCLASLLLQGRSLVNTFHTAWKRLIVLSVNYVMLAVPVLAYFICSFMQAAGMANPNVYIPDWLTTTAEISLVVCTAYHALLFVLKLGFAIHARRKLGMKQFGATQIAFIMFCQTIILPDSHLALVEIKSWSLTFLSCFLPLSSFWAGVMSKKERDELKMNQEKKRARQRQSSNSCNTVWFDNPEMARAHLGSRRKKSKRSPIPDVPAIPLAHAAHAATVGASVGARVAAAAATGGSRGRTNTQESGETIDLERGVALGHRRTRSHDRCLASIAAINRSATTLDFEHAARVQSPQASRAIMSQDDGTATVQSVESDGLSSHEVTMGRSMIASSASPYCVPDPFCESPLQRSQESMALEYDRQPFSRTRLNRISEAPSILTRGGSQKKSDEEAEEEATNSLGIRVERQVEVREERMSASDPPPQL